MSEYSIVYAYGEVYIGGRTKKMLGMARVWVNETNMVSITRMNIADKEEYSNFRNINNVKPINFGYTNKSCGGIVESCGVFSRLKDYNLVVIGRMKVNGVVQIVLYDIDSNTINTVPKSYIIENKEKFAMQNAVVANKKLQILGGVDKLIEFNPQYQVQLVK